MNFSIQNKITEKMNKKSDLKQNNSYTTISLKGKNYFSVSQK
jgi:hypothetical protein